MDKVSRAFEKHKLRRIMITTSLMKEYGFHSLWILPNEIHINAPHWIKKSQGPKCPLLKQSSLCQLKPKFDYGAVHVIFIFKYCVSILCVWRWGPQHSACVKDNCPEVSSFPPFTRVPGVGRQSSGLYSSFAS